jgi:glutamyl-tRNA synthetase
MSTVRVRFAPSPTGDLHVGGVRTGLFNYLHARAHDGVFILRIEDTDRERSKAEHTEAILGGMRWLGMEPDEGPFLQSERGELYRERIDQLLASSAAYKCFCTKDELAEQRERAMKSGGKTMYERTWRDRTDHPPEGTPYTVRIKLPLDGETTFDDQVLGTIKVENDRLEDFVIARTDGSPTYNLTVVADDIDMGITDVIRAVDHVTNTPKQIHIYRLLGAEIPRFAHVPLVHGPDGKKLSKRHGAASILAFRELGYLPETMLSFLARLGWSHGDQEEFTREELFELFDVKDGGKSAAIFDHKKLDHQNGMRIRALAPMDLLDRARPFLESAGLDPDAPWLPRAVVVVQERATTLVAVAEALRPFSNRGALDFEPKAARKFLTEDSCALLGTLADDLAQLDSWVAPEIEQRVLAFLESRELRMKAIGQPARVALTGTKVSPPLFDCMEIYGRELTLERMRGAAPPPPAEE